MQALLGGCSQDYPQLAEIGQQRRIDARRYGISKNRFAVPSYTTTTRSDETLRFGILLHVGVLRIQLTAGLAATLALGFAARSGGSSAAGPQSPSTGQGAASSTSGGQTTIPNPTQANIPPSQPRMGLNIVVLDPAHGGADLGARGTEGIRESEVILEFSSRLKQALEAQGFQVLTTRDGNDNPSFDDRSARANAQRGAIFITLHIASTGLVGTVRTYVMPELPSFTNTTGLIPWDRAQAPFVGLSRKLGDLVQQELARRFRGSPATATVAPVRQLRTTAAPAIAVEISSVAAQQRGELDRMVPGVADAIAHGVVVFRPSYILPIVSSTGGGGEP